MFMGPFEIVWVLFGVLVPVGLLALAIIGFVALVRDRRERPASYALPALRVLEERYARGEITREEFTERRAVLLDAHAETR